MFQIDGKLEVEAYTDANWADFVTDRWSTSSYCTSLGGNLVTWRSKNQYAVAMPSAKIEFQAMAHRICELLWLKIIHVDLGIKWEGKMKLYCDNKPAINITHNQVQQDDTKHVEVNQHFIKENLDSELICTPYVSIGRQLADILTKGLPSHSFQTISSKLGMKNIYSPA